MEKELKQAILQLKSEMNTRFTLIEKSISEMRKDNKNTAGLNKAIKSSSTASIFDKISSKLNDGGKIDERK